MDERRSIWPDTPHDMRAEDRIFWDWRRKTAPTRPAPGVGVRWQDKLKHRRDADGQQ